MNITLKNVKDQVIVITGRTSTTARRRGNQPGRSVSLYKRAVLSDAMRAAPLIALGFVAAATVAARRQ
jgi:hypothetical protein